MTTESFEQGDRRSDLGDVLDRSLASLWRWDWEKVAWLVLLVAAVAVRFIGLDARSMSHDESEHAWFAYNLYSGAGYQHSPVYHGPFVYHVLALFFLIFGDSTLMARVPTALFGVGVVLLIWPLRRWIGRIGAFLAATMVAFSPALLQYSRHTRHDIYEIFWALLFIIAVFSYLELGRQRGSKWLFVAAASLSLMLSIKEVSFIYGAAVGAFVALIILFRWLVGEGGRGGERGRKGERERSGPLGLAGGRELPARLSARDWWVLAGVVALALIGPLLFRVLGLGTSTYDSAGVAGLVQTLLRLLPVVVPALAAIGLAIWHLGQREQRDDPPLAFSTPTDVAILLGTLILPWLSPFLISALGYNPVNYSFPDGVMPSLSVLLGLSALAVAVGILWNLRRWLVAAGLFYAIFVFFFTTFFTNGQGIATGVVGSLGYWLSQQEVARGSQPWYYYLVIVPPYEFLPILLSIPVVLAVLIRRNRVEWVLLAVALLLFLVLLLLQPAVQKADRVGLLPLLGGLLKLGLLVAALVALGWAGLSAHRRPEGYFLAFLPFWIVLNWVAYTMAGEKMPWLTTHITLPMCIAGGWWLGRVVERVDWTAVKQRGGWWIAVLVVPLLAALAALLSSRPFQNRTIAGISETTQWLAALAGLVVILVLLARLFSRLGWRQALRVAGLTVVLLLGVWTLRTSYMLNFINQDYVSEFLFYAHASPDPAMVMAQIEDISRRTEGDKQLKVAYDDDASWPFNWYLRDWPNSAYFGASPSREALNAPVAIVGDKNLDKVRPFLARDYHEFRYRLIWWPDEGYKDTSWDKIWRGITDAEKRKEFLDVLIWRKYPTPMAEWPLVHRFSLFVRKDLAAELWDFGAQPSILVEAADPYEKGFRELSSLRVLGGGQGVAAGQLSFPRNVAVAGDGTVYVADSGNHRIQVFGPDGGLLRQWGSSCELFADGQPGCIDPDGGGPLEPGDGQMREPWGIALGRDGTVYVADTWNHRILAFDDQGNLLRKWGTFATTDGEAIGSPSAFWGPRGIAVDAAGNLYVTDTGNKRIQVFDSQGTFLGQFGGGGVIEGRFDEPVGIAIIPQKEGEPGGRLYVADTWNQRVQVLDVSYTAGQPDFEFVKEWSIAGWASQSVVNKPFLAVDAERGRVYVTDPEFWRVLVFDLEGEFKATFGLYGSDAQSFALPNGIALGPDGSVYVADADNHRIMVFPPVE